MNFKKLASTSVLVAGLAQTVFAGYSINRTDGGNNQLLVQGKAYTIRVQNTDVPLRLQDVRVQFNPTTPAPRIVVGAGVQTGIDTYALDQNGVLLMTLTYTGPNSYSMTVTNTSDSNNFSVLGGITVQRYPTSYQVTPSNPVVNANVPFQVNITAIDSSNIIVSGYEDPVQITDSQTGTITSVPGTAFVNGVASNVNVTVQAARLNNQFDLTFTLAGTPYYDPANFPTPPHEAPRATRTISNLTLIPGAFNKYVMLFPGETLVPGTGKTGTPSAQQSGIDVPLVRTYRVDQFFNPILTNPSPAANLRFTSNRTQDTVFPINITMSSPILDIVASGTPSIEFNGAGNPLVRVEDLAMGGTTEEDTSLVPVDPGSAEFYTISLSNGSNSISTDDVIQATVRAFVTVGGNPVPLTTLNGTIPGAALRADFGLAGANTAWADTNPADLIPQNVVSFNNGVATVNLTVTKAGLGCVITYQTPSAPIATSPTQFNVNTGAPNKVHFTVVGKHPNPTQGQTFTAGTYPGNSGTPPTFTAGEEAVVEARVTDARWNLVAGNQPSLQLGSNVQMNHYYESRHINPGTHPGPIYTFPVGGAFLYQNGAFDNSFRIRVRTASPSVLVPSGLIVRGVSNMAGATTCPAPTTNGDFCSSSMTVTPDAYSRMIIAAPGETLRPGIPTTTESDGKTGTPLNQQAGVIFNANAYATDQFFNPIANAPFPSINLTITPNQTGSFINEPLPIAMPGGIRAVPVSLQSSSDIIIRDNNNSAINQLVSVPIAAGPLHHFVMSNVTAQTAGVPFQVTITGQDQFNNTISSPTLLVDLIPNTGANTLTPNQVTLANGVWTGNVTMFASSAAARITMRHTGNLSATRDSNAFVVNPNVYSKLVQLLPGETLVQGTVTGKTGTATPATVGNISVIRAIATDQYSNPVNVTGNLVEFNSNRYHVLGAAQGNLVNVDGHGEYSTTFMMRTASTHTVTLRDVNNGSITNSTSDILGLAGLYRKLQVVAPGEVADPGTFVASGKTAALPTDQPVSTPFNVTIRAVDNFWNLVNFNLGDIVFTSSPTTSSFNPPNNPPLGGNPQRFVNGVATRQIILGQQGLNDLTAGDQDDLTKTPQSIQINAIPGAIYTISSPVQATAGQPFPTVTITLTNNGVPVPGNHEVYLTPQLANGGIAAGFFNTSTFTMINGSLTIDGANALVYAHSERIRIRLQDGFNRLAFSNDIEVVPSGLKYRVIVPTFTVVAGPPSSFPVRVELLEENTNTLVKNHDHEVDVQVISVVNPTTDGQFSVQNANFAQGVATFNQTYTKAESIIIRIIESATNGDPNYVIQPRNSNNVNMLADGYKKLLIVAPGETHVPGVPSSSGKTGSVTSRQKAVPFTVQVRGTDQYWNTTAQFNGGQIAFASNDTPQSLGANNPPNQNAPLVNGESASTIHLDNVGDVIVSIRDIADINIGTASVSIPVGGNHYEITVPATENTATPFTINIVLHDQNHNVITTANNPVTIEALLPGGGTANGTIAVTNGNLSNGILNITNQSYNVAEDIVIRVSDGNGDTGTSSQIHFTPRLVRYIFETPTEAEVNVPFQVTVRMIDQDTGTEVRNLNRTNTLAAYSTVNGNPAPGVFAPTTINIVNGVGLVSATYDLAESIFLRMTDTATQSPPVPPGFFNSPGSILVKAGAIATVEIADFTMQSNEVVQHRLFARDAFNNLIPGREVGLRLLSVNLPGTLTMNGNPNELIATTNGLGEIDVTFEPNVFCNGVYQVLLYDPNRPTGFSRVLNITINGFPQQPSGALELGQNRIPVNSTVFLELNNQLSGGGTLTTYYRVNGSAWYVYDSAVGILAVDPSRPGVVFFDSTRNWDIEWYSEVCYNTPCNNPISELAFLGGPHGIAVITYELDDNLVGYPNPFNPKGAIDENYLTIQYPLAVPSSVEIDIYDLFGQKVWHTDIPSGGQGGEARLDNRVFWFGTNDDGTIVANGGYIVVVNVGATGQKMRAKVLVAK